MDNSYSSTARGRLGHSRRGAGAAMIAVALLLVAACSGSSDGGTRSKEVRPVKQGGTIVVGAEQEPDCTDWIATCAGSIWGTYTMQIPTIPTVFNTRKSSDGWGPEISPLMASEPTVEEAGGKQTITYRLNPKAVWSDGQQITSADLEYTGLEVRDAKDIFDRTGYSLIESIETPDATTAVVTLKSAYAGWRTLFSGSFGVLPSHLLKGKDRAAIMKNGYDFSGGPWKIESWKRGTSATLVPNDKYWGEKPKLDKVIFNFMPDTSAAFQALRSDQVNVLYPSPQLDALSQIKSGIPGTQSEILADSGNLEGLWLNNDAFPFDSTPVRQAFAYSIDRAAIVKRLFGQLGIDEPAQSFLTPLVARFGAEDFGKYSLDLSKVDELMNADGWVKSGGVWAKDGKPAEFTMLTLAGNKRRDLTVQVLQSQLAKAGFSMKIKQTTPAELFAKTAPSGNFQAGLYTLVDTYPDPTLSTSFDSANIPSEANGRSGINFARANVPGLDALLRKVDTEVDETKRIAVSKEADKVIAEAVPSLPLQILPNVLLWSDKVGGPLSINPVEGPFWNLNQWGLAK